MANPRVVPRADPKLFCHRCNLWISIGGLPTPGVFPPCPSCKCTTTVRPFFRGRTSTYRSDGIFYEIM